MTGWRVDPDGVNRVLTTTNDAVIEVQKAFQGPADSVNVVVGAAGEDGIVASAYAGFLQENYDGAITRMFTRYASVLEGTANAANAYLAGDEQMASDTAADIASIPAFVAPPDLPASMGGGASGEGAGGGGGGGF